VKRFFCCEACWRNPTCGVDCGSCDNEIAERRLFTLLHQKKATPDEVINQLISMGWSAVGAMAHVENMQRRETP